MGLEELYALQATSRLSREEEQGIAIARMKEGNYYFPNHMESFVWLLFSVLICLFFYLHSSNRVWL